MLVIYAFIVIQISQIGEEKHIAIFILKIYVCLFEPSWHKTLKRRHLDVVTTSGLFNIFLVPRILYSLIRFLSLDVSDVFLDKDYKNKTKLMNFKKAFDDVNLVGVSVSDKSNLLPIYSLIRYFYS